MRVVQAVMVMVLFTPAARAGDWPQWLGPRRDVSTDEVVKPWKEPLKVLWKQPVGEGHSSPVVARGKVYLHTKLRDKNEEALSVFDASTGKPLAAKPYERGKFSSLFGNGPRGTPTVTDDKVYTFGITGLLTCFSAGGEKQHWQVDTLKKYNAPNLFFGASCSPLVEGDVVLVNVGGKGASVVAFDRHTGAERWKALDDKATYSSPIAVGQGENRQVIFLTASGLVSLAPKDGKVFWQHPLVDKLAESSTTPVLAGDLLFASSITYGGVGLKLKSDPPAAEQAWMKPELNCYFATPVAVGKDHLYIVTGTRPPALTSSATLRCVEAATGKELWHRDKVGTYHATLLRTGDSKLLLLEEGGDLVLLEPSPEKYTELSRSHVCGKTWAHPAVSDGRLYVRDDKELVCVQLR